MPKGYVVLTEQVHDQDGMNAYGRAATPSLIESGAAVLAADGQPQVLEGDWHGNRTIIMEFPSVEAARAWYTSAGYEQAKPLRQAAATTNAVLVAGFELPARTS